jgi:hypothetical protein
LSSLFVLDIPIHVFFFLFLLCALKRSVFVLLEAFSFVQLASDMATREPLSMSNTPRITSPRALKNGIVRKPSTQSVKSLRFARSPGGAPRYSPGSDGVLTPGYDSGHEEVHPNGSLPGVTAGLHFGGQLRVPANEQSPLFSPSAPPQQPGDELLYSLASEERPDERIFQKDFQDALSTTKAEMREISLAIWGCTAAHQAGSDLYALRKQAQALSEFEASRTRTVGLVGDSGVGVFSHSFCIPCFSTLMI